MPTKSSNNFAIDGPKVAAKHVFREAAAFIELSDSMAEVPSIGDVE